MGLAYTISAQSQYQVPRQKNSPTRSSGGRQTYAFRGVVRGAGFVRSEREQKEIEGKGQRKPFRRNRNARCRTKRRTARLDPAEVGKSRRFVRWCGDGSWSVPNPKISFQRVSLSVNYFGAIAIPGAALEAELPRSIQQREAYLAEKKYSCVGVFFSQTFRTNRSIYEKRKKEPNFKKKEPILTRNGPILTKNEPLFTRGHRNRIACTFCVCTAIPWYQYVYVPRRLYYLLATQ